MRLFSRSVCLGLGAIVALAPVVCTGPVTYRGEAPLKRDIDNVKAAAAAAGVSPELANPSIALFAGATQLASNDDWKTNANVADIMASGIAPNDDLASALLIRREPGDYTTVVSGAGGSTGIGLVEVYEIGSD